MHKSIQKLVQKLIVHYLLNHRILFTYKDKYVVRVFTKEWYDKNIRPIRSVQNTDNPQHPSAAKVIDTMRVTNLFDTESNCYNCEYYKSEVCTVTNKGIDLPKMIICDEWR